MDGRGREIVHKSGGIGTGSGQGREGPSGGRPGAAMGGRLLAGLLGSLLLLFSPGPARAFHQEDSLGISLFDTRESAPEIQAPDLSGKMRTLSSFRGKVVLLNFWATWCDACRDEIPALVALSRSLRGEPFAVVSVAMDRRTGHIPPFVRKYGIDYPVLEGRKGEVDSRYFGMGLPQSYVIRPDGTLVGRAMGARPWSSPEFVRYFRDLGKQATPTGEKGGRRNP